MGGKTSAVEPAFVGTQNSLTVLTTYLGSEKSGNRVSFFLLIRSALVLRGVAMRTKWGARRRRRRRRSPPPGAPPPLGELFRNWGIPTVRCLAGVRDACPAIPLIASGGVRHGLDAAKAIRLGADLVGQAAGLLPAAISGTEAVVAHVGDVAAALRIACLATGSANLRALARAPLLA